MLGTNDIQATVFNNGSFTFYEISHPLDSPDDAHDVSLAVGDTVGISIAFSQCGFGVKPCLETSLPGGPHPFYGGPYWLKVQIK